MATPTRILIIRPSALGDVCRTVPVLTSLRRAYPEATIDWLVQDTFAPAIMHHRDLDGVIPFPRRQFAAAWRRPTVARDALRWLKGLRGRSYDLVIDAQGLGRSGLMTWFTGAGRRIGHADARELAWIGYSHRVPSRQVTHTVDRMMALLTPLDITPIHDMRLDVDPDAETWWDTERRTVELHDVPYIVLAPTSRWRGKQWPVDRWQEFVSPRDSDMACVIIGAPGEESQVAPLLEDVRDRRDVINVLGHTSIAQTMAIIARSHAVIANDSAPLHMAVGLQRPCVALFGPTDERAVGPYGRDASVVRAMPLPTDRPVSFKHDEPGQTMMRAITVDQVRDRLTMVLDGKCDADDSVVTPRTRPEGESS
ncbi:MAG: glycosyltransferase family 9 protein [Planctomycetota bacterium]